MRCWAIDRDGLLGVEMSMLHLQGNRTVLSGWMIARAISVRTRSAFSRGTMLARCPETPTGCGANREVSRGANPRASAVCMLSSTLQSGCTTSTCITQVADRGAVGCPLAHLHHSAHVCLPFPFVTGGGQEHVSLSAIVCVHPMCKRLPEGWLLPATRACVPACKPRLDLEPALMVF